MAYLEKFYKVSTTAYRAKVTLGGIEELTNPLDINLMSIPIPLSGARAMFNLDCNGMSERFVVKGYVINGSAGATTSHDTGTSSWNTTADCVTPDRTLDYTPTTPNLTTDYWIGMMKFMGYQQLSNYTAAASPGALSAQGGGIYLTLETTTDIATGAFPLEAQTRVYMANFEAKYVAGIPNLIEYSFELIPSASL